MAKQLSPAAQAAKMIRQRLKAQGIVGSVTSDNYSMGSSVNVYVNDQPPAVKAQIEGYANQFQYGHFNGMEDIYEYSNSRQDIPQAKFVFVNNQMSAELRQKIWDFAIGYFNNFDGAPADASQASSFRIPNWNMYGDQIIWRLFSGAESAYWDFVEAQQKEVA